MPTASCALRILVFIMMLFATCLARGEMAQGDFQPAWIIELPATVSGILVADTSNASLHRFTRANDAYQWADQRYMSIGLNGVGKNRAWDKKTPLGNYFITERLDTSQMHDKYGAAAFPLDYPNAWDRYQSRTGDGIWLHGVDEDNPDRPPLDTDGCLAIPNQALLQLADDLVPLVTPVIVVSKMEWSSNDDLAALRLEFRIALEQWQGSVLDGDLLSYLSLYDAEFRHRGMDKADWSAWRLHVFESRALQAFEITDVMLLADPREQHLYLSRFTQVLDNGEQSIRTTKRLYWKRSEGNRWSIVAEDAG